MGTADFNMVVLVSNQIISVPAARHFASKAGSFSPPTSATSDSSGQHHSDDHEESRVKKIREHRRNGDNPYYP